jgi:hypothetical protein
MLPINLAVYNMGAFADRILAQGRPASVQGTTSRGCYLLVRSRWVLFLTTAASRGPLTLNLRGDEAALRSLIPGTPVDVQGGFLQIGSTVISLKLEQAHRWQPPARPAVWLSAEERRNRQIEVGKQLLERQGASISGSLISLLLGLPSAGEAPKGPAFSPEKVQHLRAALVSRDERLLLPALEWFLGRGPGLTPSGDDLIVGLFLALHRWGDVLCQGLDLAALSQRLLPLAYHKTSTLAANLIACASVGQADERLVSALDGLVAGEPGPGECAAQLLAYGSSSGCDSFLGMLLAEG